MGATRTGSSRPARRFMNPWRAAFQEFLTADWQRAHPECGPVVGVDATGSEAAVSRKVIATVTSRWPSLFEGAPLPG